MTRFLVAVYDARGHERRRVIGPFGTLSEADHCARTIRALTAHLTGHAPRPVQARVAPLNDDADAVLIELIEGGRCRAERPS
jgi:hypothetical protein